MYVKFVSASCHFLTSMMHRPGILRTQKLSSDLLRIQNYGRFSFFHPGVFRNIALHASFAAMNSDFFNLFFYSFLTFYIIIKFDTVTCFFTTIKLDIVNFVLTTLKFNSYACFICCQELLPNYVCLPIHSTSFFFFSTFPRSFFSFSFLH